MGRILDLLDKDRGAPPVRPVFISVDPDRDNVAQMRHYAQGLDGMCANGMDTDASGPLRPL